MKTKQQLKLYQFTQACKLEQIMEKLLNLIQLVLSISGLFCSITLSVMYFEPTLFHIIFSAIMIFLVGVAVCISFKEFINKN